MIEEAKERNLENVEFVKANAVKLPYEDESMDYVINEAMLTMLPNETKRKQYKNTLGY